MAAYFTLSPSAIASLFDMLSSSPLTAVDMEPGGLFALLLPKKSHVIPPRCPLHFLDDVNHSPTSSIILTCNEMFLIPSLGRGKTIGCNGESRERKSAD
jgi:hypothetical protein